LPYLVYFVVSCINLLPSNRRIDVASPFEELAVGTQTLFHCFR
jgi:hypothetical protein